MQSDSYKLVSFMT